MTIFAYPRSLLEKNRTYVKFVSSIINTQTLGLDSPAITSYDLMLLTRQGIPKAAIDSLANSLHLSVSELTKYLHISERTLQRYSPDQNI